MTVEQWLAQAERDKAKLIKLLNAYHPVNRTIGGTNLPITAHNAEAACRQVRRQIIESGKENNPVGQFERALEEKNWQKINSLLNSAWFGVPESTLCWNIEGFTEAVSLMEDLPDDDNGEEASAYE